MDTREKFRMAGCNPTNCYSRTFLLILIVFINSCTGINKMDRLDQYNVSWDTPGNISNNSMPAGNGDLLNAAADIIVVRSRANATPVVKELVQVTFNPWANAKNGFFATQSVREYNVFNKLYGEK